MQTHDPSRRRLLGGSVLTLAGLALACSRPGASAARRPRPVLPPPKVRIAEFDRAGKRLRVVELPKVVKTLEQWKAQLPPKSFYCHPPGRHRDRLHRALERTA
jgi:hypothetical protein